MEDMSKEEKSRLVEKFEEQILRRASDNDKPSFENLTPRGAIVKALKREPSWVTRRREALKDHG